MVRTMSSNKRWSRRVPLGALLIGVSLATVGLGGRALGLVRSKPADRVSPGTTDSLADPSRPPVPIRPGCCLPPLPPTFEAICRGDMSSTECAAAGGRTARSCLRCGYALTSESEESSFMDASE